MSNFRGAVVHPDTIRALRDHRERLRMLEANRSGSGVKGSAWQDATLVAPWTSSIAATPGLLFCTDPPVQYQKTGNIVTMRGRPVGGPDGGHVLNLPAGMHPPRDMNFVGDLGCGWGGPTLNFGAGNFVAAPIIFPSAGIGHVRVKSNGQVFINNLDRGDLSGPGQTLSPFDPFTFGAGANIRLREDIWNQAFAAYVFAYQPPGVGWCICPPPTAGTCITAGSPAGSSIPGLGAVYMGGGEYTDGEVSVTIQTNDPVTLILGLRINTFCDDSSDYQAGIWGAFASGGGPVRVFSFGEPVAVGVIISDSVSPWVCPGFGIGDVITWRINGHVVSAYKNGNLFYFFPLHFNPSAPTFLGPETNAKGLFGFGFDQSVATNGCIISNWTTRSAANLGVSLNQVQFSVAA